MSSYAVEFARSAGKELAKLPPPTRLRILRAIDQLSKNPRSGNTRPMVGSSSWRLRVGDYRVVYDIFDSHLVITIIRVRHRREAYRK